MTDTDEYKKLLSEFGILQKLNTELTKENIDLVLTRGKLRSNVQSLQDRNGLEICEYFGECNSLRRTADEYCFDNVSDCYESLSEYNSDSDFLKNAEDYMEYYSEIFGREYDDCSDDDCSDNESEDDCNDNEDECNNENDDENDDDDDDDDDDDEDNEISQYILQNTNFTDISKEKLFEYQSKILIKC
jgi:hypothetical protein